MRAITTLKELKEVADSGVLFIVWFSAAWCGPCQSLDKQTLTEMATNLGIELVYCDIDAGAPVAKACAVKTIPTFQAFVDGEPDIKHSGADFLAIRRFFHKVAALVDQ